MEGGDQQQQGGAEWTLTKEEAAKTEAEEPEQAPSSIPTPVVGGSTWGQTQAAPTEPEAPAEAAHVEPTMPPAAGEQPTQPYAAAQPQPYPAQPYPGQPYYGPPPGQEVDIVGLFRKSIMMVMVLLGALLVFIGIILAAVGDTRGVLVAGAALKGLGAFFIGIWMLMNGLFTEDYSENVRMGLVIGGSVTLGAMVLSGTVIF